MKYKYTTARQVGGDDGYCWAVFLNGRQVVNGLTKREVPHYRDKFEAQGKKQDRLCRCRAPRRHRDCMYCGSGWAGEVICGICKENGIDGKLIPGTGRVCCASHKKGS